MLLVLVLALLQPVRAGDTVPASPPAPSVSDDATDLDGGFDLDAEEGTLPEGAVAEVLKKNEWAVTDCASRLGGSALHGRLELTWEIGLTGAASQVVKKESDLRNPPFEECITKAVSRMKFPAPRGGVMHTSHTFSF